MKDDHRASECTSRAVRTCYICGNPDHTKKDCPSNENVPHQTQDPRDKKAEDHKQTLEQSGCDFEESDDQTEIVIRDLVIASPAASQTKEAQTNSRNRKKKKTQEVQDTTTFINSVVEDMLQSKAATKRPIQNTPEKAKGKKKPTASKRLALSTS